MSLKLNNITFFEGATKTLKAVAPLLDPFDRVGNCIFHLDFGPYNRKRSISREIITIPFNTRLKNIDQYVFIPEKVKNCKRFDQDPLNECKPVNCDIYYNGKKSYFDKLLRRCVKVPNCVQKRSIDRPTIYDPNTNRCVNEKYITTDDLEYIKDLARNTRRAFFKKRTRKPYQINFKSKPGKYAVDHNNKLNKVHKIKNYLSMKCTYSVLAFVITIQCCLIFTMVYIIFLNCNCQQNKKVQEFFNNSHDVSVTTPLICTSNVDTNTPELLYASESSNVDKRIKCYKACQKERKNNMKLCMSDDILSKCLTRRDWNCKPARSDAMPQTQSPRTEDVVLLKAPVETSGDSKSSSDRGVDRKKSSDAKVNFENEVRLNYSGKEKKQNKFVKSIIKKMETKGKDKKNNEHTDMSEMEIKCHSYNYMDDSSNTTSFQPSTGSKNYGIYKIDKSGKTKSMSLSSEKGAQASFTNDSVDDFLSERGMIYLAGNKLSKCSFTSSSNYQKKSSSSDSSKTSKNKIVRNVLSLIHRRSSKQCVQSAPAVTQPETPVAMQLLHMSQASIYSSSNYESDYLKGVKKIQDSRTSF